MRVIEDPFSLPDEQFRMAVFMASGYVASQFSVVTTRFPGGVYFTPRMEKVISNNRGKWVPYPVSNSILLKSNISPSLGPGYEKIVSGRNPKDFARVEQADFIDIYLKYLLAFPKARDFILNNAQFDDLFPDPLMGFGLMFKKHELAVAVTGRFVENLPSRSENIALAELEEFRVDLIQSFWQRYFDALIESGFEIEKRVSPPIGEGAWTGLSMLMLADVFQQNCFCVPPDDLRRNPLIYLRRNPSFRSWTHLEYRN